MKATTRIRSWLVASMLCFLGYSVVLAETEVQTSDGKGYVATFQGRGSLIGTADAVWDFSHPGFSDIDNEISLSFRARFNIEASLGEYFTIVTISHPKQRNFFQLSNELFMHDAAAMSHGIDEEVWKQWNHYTMTFKYVDGVGGSVKLLRNGQEVFDTSTKITSFKLDDMYFVLGGNPYSLYTEPVSAAANQMFTGQIDSVILHSRAISDAEALDLSNKNPDPEVASVEDPSIVLYYTFDADCGDYSKIVPSVESGGLLNTNCYVTGKPVAKNYGVAGERYNLLLDGVDNSLGFGYSWIPSGETSEKRLQPVGRGRPLYTSLPSFSSPHVYHLQGGQSIEIELFAKYTNGSTVTMSNLEISSYPNIGNLTILSQSNEVGRVLFTAPITVNNNSSWFDQPVVFTYNVTSLSRPAQQVHIWPLQRPFKSAVQSLDRQIKEDSVLFTHWTANVGVDPLGEYLGVKVTRLPGKGTIQRVNGEVISAQNTVVGDSTGSVSYIPNTDGTGFPYDTYAVKFFHSELMTSTIESDEFEIVISVTPENDLPTVQQGPRENILEDNKQGILIHLDANDVEGEPFATIITKLPKKGKLYLTSDDTLHGVLEHVSEAYKHYDSGDVFAQYANKVASVSSFWGAPLYFGYHAMGILGRPTCSITGECSDERYLDGSDPIVGDVLTYNLKWAADPAEVINVPAQVLEVDENAQGAKVYKVLVNVIQRETSPGQYARCLPTGTDFPQDCDPNLVSAKLDNNGDHVESNVPRHALDVYNAGVWCPLMRNYDGSVTRVGGETSAAFGNQYDFANSQRETWTTANPPYTEYIEVEFEESVFASGFIVGSPRGPGAVVSIKAKDLGSGQFKQVYAGLPLREFSQVLAEEGTYHNWEIPLCRTSFATNHIRLELDTESISEWNYIDYVQLLGANQSVQRGFLRWPKQNVVYIPDPDQHGQDSFEYQATDCMGSRFRTSETSAVVNIDIQPANDAPMLRQRSGVESIHIMPQSSNVDNPDLAEEIVTQGYEVTIDVEDVDGDTITVSPARLPQNAAVDLFSSMASQIQILGDGTFLRSAFNITLTPNECTDISPSHDLLILQATDTSGTSTSLTIKVIIDCSALTRTYERLVVSERLQSIIRVVNGVGIVTTIGWILFNIIFWKRKTVRFSSPPLNLVVLLGCILVRVSLPYFGGSTVGIRSCDNYFAKLNENQTSQLIDICEPDSEFYSCCIEGGREICTLKNWLFCIGSILAFGALYAKTHRIAVLLTSKTIKRVTITNTQLLSRVAVCFIVGCAGLALWSAFYPAHVVFRSVSEVLDQENQLVVVKAQEFCGGENYESFLMLIGVVFAATLIGGVVLAYKVRHVKMKGANDAKSILYSMYNLAIFASINAVISQVVENPVNNFVFIYVVSFLTIISFEFSLFLPRVLELRDGSGFSSSSRTSRVGTNPSGMKVEALSSQVGTDPMASSSMKVDAVLTE